MKRFLFPLICLLFASQLLYAQRVGLVLSGGGAKGLAHLGVIKALEENEIPIDYIAGTSMGGLIGGFYAAGYTSDQIQDIIFSERFRDWVTGRLVEDYNFYYNKKEDNASWLTVDFAIDSTLKASFKSNLANDLSLNFALAELMAKPAQRAHYNFDSLFLPYRTVGADVFTQSDVPLDSGNLGTALRATMAVPLFYRPAKVNKKYLFDGGLYNNFPLDVMDQSFHPDVVIGVNVSNFKHFDAYPYGKDEKLLDASLLSYILTKSKFHKKEPRDVIIDPDLKSYSGFSFEQAQAIIDSGYVATMRKMDSIKAKVQRRVTCDSVAKKRNEFLVKEKPLLFNNIELEGFSRAQRKYVRRVFDLDHSKGQKLLSISEVKRDYYKLASEDYFFNIFPEISYDSLSQKFVLKITRTPVNKFNIDFGGNISTRTISEVYLGLRYNQLNRWLFNHQINFYTGRFYQSAQYRVRINFPLRTPLYIEPILSYNRFDYLSTSDILAEDGKPTPIKTIDRLYGLHAGIPLGRQYKLLIKSYHINNAHKYSNYANFNATDTLDEMDFIGFRHGIAIDANSLNRKQFPNAGRSFSVGADFVYGHEHYEPGSTSLNSEVSWQFHSWFNLKAQYLKYSKWGKYSLGYEATANLSTFSAFNNYWGTLTYTPAYYPLYDSRTFFLERFRASNYGALALDNVWQWFPSLEIRLKTAAFLPLSSWKENAQQRAEEDRLPWKVHLAAATGLVYHSPIGPISLMVNYQDDEQKPVSFMLNIGYLLYNPSALF